jgi:toxin ParE1/3/4
MTKIYWTSRALKDLDSIFDFAARSSEQYAQLIVQRIVRAVSRLEDFPDSGRVVLEYARQDIREVILKPYRIVYRVLGQEVHILVVQHSARMLPEELPQ